MPLSFAPSPTLSQMRGRIHKVITSVLLWSFVRQITTVTFHGSITIPISLISPASFFFTQLHIVTARRSPYSRRSRRVLSSNKPAVDAASGVIEDLSFVVIGYFFGDINSCALYLVLCTYALYYTLCFDLYRRYAFV